MQKPHTFSHYAIATLSNHPSLNRFVAVQAVLHSIAMYQERAQARAAALTERQAREIMEGPKTVVDLGGLLDQVTSEAAAGAADPMPTLAALLQRRAEEFRVAEAGSTESWLDKVLSPLNDKDEESGLARVLAKNTLSQRLTAAAASLRDDHATKRGELQAGEEALRQRTAAALRASQKPPEERTLIVRSPRTIFVATLASFILIAFAIQVLSNVPFVPVPLGAMLLGIVAASVGASRYSQPGNSQPDQDLQPFLPLRPQLVAYGRAFALNQKLEMRIGTVELALDKLNRIHFADLLPEKLRAVQSVLLAENSDMPDGFWTGVAPTFGGLTGKLLVTALWEARKPRWVNADFDRNLGRLNGSENLEDTLIARSSESVTKILCEAAELAIGTISFTETINVALHTVPDGTQSVLGEVSSQIGLLRGMLTIQSFKTMIADPACPLLVHIVLPASLKEALEPALHQAFREETLDFYPTPDDTHIRIVVESFNRSNAERDSYPVYMDAYQDYAERAEAEMWSAFGPLSTPIENTRTGDPVVPVPQPLFPVRKEPHTVQVPGQIFPRDLREGS